jgi:pyridoxamine 5'-phosphate oxidase
MRQQYRGRLIDPAAMFADPMEEFRGWFADAVDAGLAEPNAMVLGTVSSDGTPHSRHVLLKNADHGFVFFTNYFSAKGRHLSDRPVASLCFPWFAMERQVCVAGRVERLDHATNASYWSLRPRDAQLGAWASHQSQPIADRAALVSNLDEVADRFAMQDVPLPDFWGGFRVLPDTVEFWQGHPGRLHDRIRYSRVSAEVSAEQAGPAGSAATTSWQLVRLQP